jgi:putative DNA primase/helicase
MASSPIEKVLAKLQGVRPSGDSGRQWMACCPRHADAKPSLGVGVGRDGRVLLNCHGGCDYLDVVAALGMTEAELYADGKPADDKPVSVTVALLAFTKRLPEKFLRDECGLTDGMNRGRAKVGIPYRDEAGELIATKDRTALSAKDGSYWPAGQPVAAYGLWRLPAERAAKKSLILVEGESDCWSLWLHGFAALGVPGADASKVLSAEALAGFDQLYIWQETDAGGAKFIIGIRRRLKQLGYVGEAFIVAVEAVKDPNLLHQRDPEAFKAAIDAAIAAAKPLGEPSADDDAPASSKKKQRAPRAAVIPGVVQAKSEETSQIPSAASGYYGMTDWGNAQRLTFRYGKDIRYCYAWESWMAWNGKRWMRDADAEVEQKVKKTVLSIYQESENCKEALKRQQLALHAVRSESCRAILATIRLARSEALVDVDHNQLDADPWLFNVPNGTIDLRTGNILSHRREHLITQLCPTAYEPDAVCPLWEKFLADVFRSDQELISYVQRLLGYSLSGDVSTHLLAVFWGSGGNGKGTLLNTLLHVFGGDYGDAAVAELLMARRGDRHPTEVADLFGKRFVVCQETEDGCRLNESLVKWLTGGDRLKARRMRENFWEFNPTHKLILSTNYRPVVRGTDRGIWRRLRLIPFTVTFSGAGEDTGLSDRLKAEAKGILAWCVRGCLDWVRDGERTPKVVQVATSDYKHDEDLVFRFVGECCVTGNDLLTEKPYEVRSSALYEAFKEWTKKAGEEDCVSKKKFGIRIVELGYQRFTNNGPIYLGIALADSRNRSATNGKGHRPTGKEAASGFDLSNLDN